MIIQIDDQYFNPEQVTSLIQQGNAVKVLLSNPSNYLVLVNWKIENLSAEINRNIEEFHIDNYVQALKRFQGIIGRYDGKESRKTKSG